MQLLEKFSKPENWDKVADGTGWVMYAGGNDWENSSTSAWVVFPSDDANRRVWFKIKFPEVAQPDSGKPGGSKDDNRDDCRTHAEKAWRAWVRAAKSAHKNRNHGSRSWLQAFKAALYAPEMKRFVDSHGEETTKWDEVKESLKKAPMDAKNIIARAKYKASRLKAKGWQPGDFARVYCDGPGAQKRVSDEVKARAQRTVEAMLDNPEDDPNEFLDRLEPSLEYRLKQGPAKLVSPSNKPDEFTAEGRIVLHQSLSSGTEWVTHWENMQVGGYSYGHYFRDDWAGALADYKKRCTEWGVDWRMSTVSEDGI